MLEWNYRKSTRQREKEWHRGCETGKRRDHLFKTILSAGPRMPVLVWTFVQHDLKSRIYDSDKFYKFTLHKWTEFSLFQNFFFLSRKRHGSKNNWKKQCSMVEPHATAEGYVCMWVQVFLAFTGIISICTFRACFNFKSFGFIVFWS